MADEWNFNNVTWDEFAIGYGEVHPVWSFSTEFYSSDSLSLSNPITDTLVLERISIPLVEGRVNASAVKLITRVWPLILGDDGEEILVYVGSQERTPNDPVVYSPAVTFTLGTDEFVNCWVSGRYACVKFESNSTRPWTLVSYIIDFEGIGQH